MVNNDIIATALSLINNAEHAEKRECIIKPVSKLLSLILSIMKDHGYIENFEEIEDDKGNYIRVILNGSINKCGAIKPRFNVKVSEIVDFEKKYLPARDFGIIMISTNKGLMTHLDAKKNGIGGSVISYVY